MALNATRSNSCTRQWTFLGSTAWRSAKTKALMLARLLHERTTVCQTWIAEKLFMGSPATVCQQLRRFNHRVLSAPDLHHWRLLSKIDA